MAITPISKAENELLTKVETGEMLNLTGYAPADKIIQGPFLAELALGQRAHTRIHPRGIRVKDATIVDEFNLSGGADPQGDRLITTPPMELEDCTFEERIDLSHARIARLSLEGSTLRKGLDAQGAVFGGTLNFISVEVAGKIDLLGATIHGDFYCVGGRFDNKGKDALFCDRLVISGAVLMRSVKRVTGKVSLLGARIGNNLEFSGSRFDNEGGVALSFDGAEIRGSVLMREGFEARGQVRLLRTRIGGSLQCWGSKFDNEDGDALSFDGAEIRGSVLMHQGFEAKGTVCCTGVTIGGNFDCSGGSFQNGEEVALNCERAEIAGNLILGLKEVSRPFVASGAVDFSLARVKGRVTCEGGWFNAPGRRYALSFRHAEIDGPMEFGDAHNVPSIVYGCAELDSVRIGGDLILSKAIFRIEGSEESIGPLRHLRSVAAGIRDFKLGVSLSLVGAEISGALESRDFAPPFNEEKFDTFLTAASDAERVRCKEFDLNAEETEGRAKAVTARLVWVEKVFKKGAIRGHVVMDYRKKVLLPNGLFDFRGATVRHLADHPLYGWPGPEGQVDLDGFKYETLDLLPADDSPSFFIRIAGSRKKFKGHFGKRENNDELKHKPSSTPFETMRERRRDRAKDIGRRREAWLHHQYPGADPKPSHFKPQPFEQLAKTLRAMGHDNDADHIASAKRRFRRRCRAEDWPSRWLSRFLEYSCDFGYSPRRAMGWLTAAVMLGFVLANEAWQAGLIRPECDSDCVEFNAWTYALDVFVPVIDLEQKSSFNIVGKWLPLFEGIYALSGWILISIAVITFTGLLRRD